MDKINTKDIDVIVNALDFYVKKERKNFIINQLEMIMSILAFGNPHDKNTVEFAKKELTESKEKFKTIEENEKVLNDKITIIKAKLIQQKDSIMAGELIDSIKG